MDFGKYIKELLLLHDCVILPGLGGFVANYKPAEFNPARNTASPPSKHILFNHNLIHNDGLLYAYVSDVTDYGYKDVRDMALAYTDRIRKETRKGMKHVIDGLGYFYLDKEQQIQFTEEAGNNFLLESYGLPFLQYREFEKFPKTETYRSLSSGPDPLARQRKIRRWIYTTAAACLVAAMVLVPVKTGYFDRAGIDIPTADSFQKEQPVQAEPSSEPKTPAAPDRVTQASLNSAFETQYHIVVGSFRDFGNARQLRNKLVQGGHKARILCSDKDYFRVSSGTYSGHSEATGHLAAVRREYKNAWVLSN